jgi:transcriptional regulator of acetoin/glycerol metabolism
VVTARELREHRERLDTFMRIAREGVDRLYDSLRPAKYCVLLTDAAGVTVDLRTVPELEREFRAEGFRDGTRWSEMEGHLRRRHQPCRSPADPGASGRALPLPQHRLHLQLGADLRHRRRPLAVLDASALNSPEHRESQVLVFQMVVEKARLIEDAFAFHSLRSYWILQLGRSPELMHVHTDYLVAFDDGGHRGGNRRAWQELLQRRGPAPEYIGDLFECSAARSALCVPRPPGAGDPAAHPGQWRAHLRAAPRPDARPRSAPHPVASGGEAVSTAEARGFGHLATDDPRVRNNVQRALKVVNRDIPVMLLGETGTGKEAFAKAIHDAATATNSPSWPSTVRRSRKA